ncbi:hypothetical protein STAS_16639 [Striga asiatica]|uniref:Uncharacterized protein n=1 Tax=Striga asiatica TaxID=4170 RepID=A0A5A7Q7I5_STRAF|nr:hypothetical protein STAS_16639 [Striga asiatica]
MRFLYGSSAVSEIRPEKKYPPSRKEIPRLWRIWRCLGQYRPGRRLVNLNHLCGISVSNLLIIYNNIDMFDSLASLFIGGFYKRNKCHAKPLGQCPVHRENFLPLESEKTGENRAWRKSSGSNFKVNLSSWTISEGYLMKAWFSFTLWFGKKNPNQTLQNRTLRVRFGSAGFEKFDSPEELEQSTCRRRSISTAT